MHGNPSLCSDGGRAVSRITQLIGEVDATLMGHYFTSEVATITIADWDQVSFDNFPERFTDRVHLRQDIVKAKIKQELRFFL